MGDAKAKFNVGERVCRIDLDEGRVETEGMDAGTCKKLLRSLLDE